MTVAFVHVPRTGGLALTEALRGSGVRTQGHALRLSGVDAAITILRDPVARFVSAYDHQRPAIDLEELAQDPARGGWFFDPATAWLDVDRPLLWVGRTESLAADVARLWDLLGFVGHLPPGYNASTRRSTLSPAGEAAVRAWYAADRDLLERLT